MATSFAMRKGRKHKMRLMREKEDQMVVKSLSVPPGLEALMEGLTREVLRMQPQDICLFASEHFAKLIKMREATGDDYQFCKTTIHDKLKQKNAASRIAAQNQKACPKAEVEILDDNVPVSVPRLDFGRLTNGTPYVSPEIKRNRSEASTAEIDKVQDGFFESKPAIDVVNAKVEETNQTEHEEAAQSKDEEENDKDNNVTMPQAQIKDDVKNTEPAEHDETEPDKTEEKDDVITKEESEELAGGTENVQSNIVGEDNGIKESQGEENDTEENNEVSENIEQDVVTKESTEIPNVATRVKEKEATDKEVITAHDECAEPVTNIANKEEYKGNKGNLDRIEEKEHLIATDEEHNTRKTQEDKNIAELKEAVKNETNNDDKEESNDIGKVSEIIPLDEQQTIQGNEDILGENKTYKLKEESGKNIETAGELKDKSPREKSQDTELENVDGLKKEETDNKLETTEEQDELSDSNDVVTQEADQEMPSAVDKVKSPVKEIASKSSSLEDKPIVSNEIEVEDSTEAKVVDENLEKVENKPTENNEELEKDIINDKVTEKELDSETPVDHTLGEEAIKTDGVTDVNSSMENDKLPEEHQVQKLAIPEISTTVATPTPSEDGSTTVDNVTKEEEEEEHGTDDKHREEQIRAATKLQSLWRGYSLRKRRNASTVGNVDDVHKLTAAATVIQALWRGYNFRKSNNAKPENTNTEEAATNKDPADVTDEHNLAATKIQSSWRGYNVRKKRHIDMNDNEPENTGIDEIDTNKDPADVTDEQNVAATKIQSSWRGYNVRNKRHIDMNKLDKASDEEQNKTSTDERENNQAEQKEIAKEIMAATVIQALWRGYIIRKSRNLGPSNESTTQLDADIESGKLNLAAAKIQSLWRGYNYRKGKNLSTAVNETPIKENLSETTEHKEDEDIAKATPDDFQEAEKKMDTTLVESDKVESELQADTGPVVETEKESENIVQPSDSAVSAKEEIETTEPEIKADKASKVESGNTDETTDSEANIAEVTASTTKSDTEDEKTAETSEHTEGHGGIIKTNADENETIESEKTSEENTETTINTNEPESEIKSENVAETTEPIAKEDEAKGVVKSEHLSEKTEPVVKEDEIVKTDEAEDEGKSEEVTETAEPVVKDKSDVKSEELAEKAEPLVKEEEIVKTDKVEGDEKLEVAENPEPVIKGEDIVKTDKAEDERKSEEVTETAGPVVKTDGIVKTDETESEVKSEEVAEKAEPVVKEEEIVVKSDEAEVKSEELAEKTEPAVKTEDIIKTNEAEDEAKSEVTEIAEPAVKEEEIVKTNIAEDEAKSEVTEKDEPDAKEEDVTRDKDEVKSEVAEIAEPVVKEEEIVKTNQVEGDEKLEVAEKHEHFASAKEEIVKIDEDEGDSKSEEVEPIVKGKTTEMEDEIKSEEISKRAETENKVMSEDTTESAEPTEDANSLVESKDVIGTTENHVKPEEINEPKVKDDKIVEASVTHEETTETVESSVSDKDTPELINSSAVAADSMASKPEENADIAESGEKPEEFSETSQSEAKAEDTAADTSETDKTVDSEIDTEKTGDLHEVKSTPISENLTQELVEKVESIPGETENDSMNKTELQSDKKVDSTDDEVKETEETNAIDNKENGNTDLDESKTISDSEKHSESNEVDKQKLAEVSRIVPESGSNTLDAENVGAKNANGTYKIEADDNVDIKADNSDISEHTTITTPSEEVVEEHATTSPGIQETSHKDTANTVSKEETVPALHAKEENKTDSEYALSKDVDRNEEPISTVTTDEGLKEPSTLILEDSIGESLTKLKENVKPSDEENSEQDEHTKSLNGTDTEQTNKDVHSTDAPNTTEIHDSKNTESDENKEINTHESVSASVVDGTQVEVDTIKEPEIKKESVATVEANPIDSSQSKKEETSNKTEISDTTALDQTSEEQNIHETAQSANDRTAEIKNVNQSEPMDSSNEIKSEIVSETENKSLDKDESLVKTDTDHLIIDTATEVHSLEIANDGTSEIDLKGTAKQDFLGKTEEDESKKKNDAATKIQSTWRGFNVRKSNITDPEIKSENETEENEGKSSADTESKVKDEITEKTVDTDEKTSEELETPKESGNDSTNTDGPEGTADKVTDESKAAEEDTKIIEPADNKIVHSTEHSELTKQAETNDTSEINIGEMTEDASKTDEHRLDAIVTNEAVPGNTKDEQEISEKKEDNISSTVLTDGIEQEEVSERLDESSPHGTDKVLENVEESKKLKDVPTLGEVEPNVEKSKTTHCEIDTKLKEEHDTCSEITDTVDSRADDHKEAYQESEASTVDIRDVEDCLKSPVHTQEEGNDLELNIHEDGEKLNDSSDTKHLLDAENRVKFYVGPDKSNQIQIVDKEQHENTETTNSNQLSMDEASDENNSKMHKSIISVLLPALNDDSDELEKSGSAKESSDNGTSIVAGEKTDNDEQDTVENTNVVATNHSTMDGKDTTQADDTNNTIIEDSSEPTNDAKIYNSIEPEEHQNDDKNNTNIENSSEPNKDTKTENITEPEDNKDQQSIDNSSQNDNIKSPENMSTDENEKLDDNKDKEKLATNIENFDKALLENEEKEKESHDMQADVTHKDDTEDTAASVTEAENASVIPAKLENIDESYKTTDTVVENHTANETNQRISPPGTNTDHQHLVSSENKSGSVQSEHLSPANLHEDSASVSDINNSKDIETTQDTTESTGTPELQTDKKVDSTSGEVKEIEENAPISENITQDLVEKVESSPSETENDSVDKTELQSDKEIDSADGEVKEIEENAIDIKVNENIDLDESKTISDSEKHSETNDVDKEKLTEVSGTVPESGSNTLDTENVETITTPVEEVVHVTTSAEVQETSHKDTASSVSKEETASALHAKEENKTESENALSKDVDANEEPISTVTTDEGLKEPSTLISGNSIGENLTNLNENIKPTDEENSEQDEHTKSLLNGTDTEETNKDLHSTDAPERTEIHDSKNTESDENKEINIHENVSPQVQDDQIKEPEIKKKSVATVEASKVKEHENIETDETTTHILANTADIDTHISHKPDSMSSPAISAEDTHSEDNVNSEHADEEIHEASHMPVAAEAEVTHAEISHKSGGKSPSPVNVEDKHSVDEADKDVKNVESDEIKGEDVSHIKESVNETKHNADEVKNIELEHTHTSAITTPEHSPIELSKEQHTDKNIEENEPVTVNETTNTTLASSAEDKEQMEHSKENLNDIRNVEENKSDNIEESEHIAVDSNKSDVETKAHHDKENITSNTTEDKNTRENIHKDSTNELKQNEENNLDINDMKEENKTDEIMIKHIESQIEHDVTDDSETKQNQATVLEGTTTSEERHEAPLEKEGNSDVNSSADNETSDKMTEKDKAAVKIQSTWKGHNLRRTLHENKELAILQRPAECDELSCQTNVAEDADRMSQAATTIQAGVRGYLVRRRRHLAKPTEVSSEIADSATVDESDSASQVTVIEKQANTLDTSQSSGSMENIKPDDEEKSEATPKEMQENGEESTSTITKDTESNMTNTLDTTQSLSSTENTKLEDEAKNDTTPIEIQTSAEESTSTITKDAEANITNTEKLETITETTNPNANGNNLLRETDIKYTDNEKQTVEKLEKPEDTANSNEKLDESVEEQDNKEKETTHSDDEKELDQIDDLNLRLRNLNRTNVYQIEEEKEPDDKVDDSHQVVKINFDRALSDLHTQTSKSSDDDESVMTAPSVTEVSKPDDSHKEFETEDKHKELDTADENKEVAHILEEAKPSTTPRLSVNLDDFDSSRYDLKVDHATARAKNTSPVHELTSAAYKIGAAIATDDETIVDAMDESTKEKREEKPVEYIHIPLQGPLPERVEEKPIEKDTFKASQEHGISSDKTADDGESPEYIYIPLKAPGAVDEENEEKNTTETNVENIKDTDGDLEHADNQKEETKHEDTSPQTATENKDNNEDTLKEKLPVLEHNEHLETEPNEQKQNMSDEQNKVIVLEDKKENEIQREEEHLDAEKLNESSTDNVIEKESNNETNQITEIPEPVPLMDKEKLLSSEAKSIESNLVESKCPEPKLLGSKTPELMHSEKLEEETENLAESVEVDGKSLEQQVSKTKSRESELAQSKSIETEVSEEPIEKLTTKENIEQSPVSVIGKNKSEPLSSETKSTGPNLVESKSPEQELSESKTPELMHSKKLEKETENSAKSVEIDGKSSEHQESETKSPEPELSKNITVVPIHSETESKSPDTTVSEQLTEKLTTEEDTGLELSENKSPESLLSETKAPENLLLTNKSPESVLSGTKTLESELSENKSDTMAPEELLSTNKSLESVTKTPETELLDNKSPEPLLTDTKAPVELLSTNKSPEPVVSETKTPLQELSDSNSSDPLISETKAPEGLLTTDKSPESVVSGTNASEPELSENKSPEPLLSETKAPVELLLTNKSPEHVDTKTPKPELSENRLSESVASETKTIEPELSESKSSEPLVSESKSSEPLVSETKAPGGLLATNKSPEPVVSGTKTLESELSESKSSEPLISETEAPEGLLATSKSPEHADSETKTPEPALSENTLSESVASETKTPLQKLSESKSAEPLLSETKAPENLLPTNKSPETVLSGTKNLESELSESKSSEPLLSGTQAPEGLLATSKSPEHVDTKTPEPELSENKLLESVASETKTPLKELSENESPEPLLSETNASEKLLPTNKSPEPEHSEKAVENVTSAQDTNRISPPRTPTPQKSTSPIDDIDAFLQRNKSRTISRQQNVDSSSHKTLFAEIDSLIQTYGHKRQMSPTSSDQRPDLDSAQIENDSRAQGQQLSVQDDVPDVIMANSAATKIQSAYRGYHTRQQLKDEQQQRGVNKLEEVHGRKNSSESDKTYTIEKRLQDNISTPETEEDVSSEEDSMKHKAATTIQTSFRDYRKKRSTSTEEQNTSNDKQADTSNLGLQNKMHDNKTSVEQNTAQDVKTEESIDHSYKILEEEKDSCQNKTSLEDNLLEQEDKIKQPENSGGNSSAALQHSQSATSMVDHETLAQQEKSKTPSDEQSTNLISHDNDEQQNVTADEKIKEKDTNVHQPTDGLHLKQETTAGRRHSPDLGQVQNLKITELEDKFLDQPVTGDSGTDARREELKDISEMTHDDAAIKIQSTYRGFKTRQNLKTNNGHSLDSIPEAVSPNIQEMNKEENDTIEDRKNEEDTTENEKKEHEDTIEDGKKEHKDTKEDRKKEHEDTIENEKDEHEDMTENEEKEHEDTIEDGKKAHEDRIENEKNEHEDTTENEKNEHEDKNKESDEEHQTDNACGTAIHAHLDSSDVDTLPASSPDASRPNSRGHHKDKSTAYTETTPDAWRYRLLNDATSDEEDSTAKDETTTTIYDSEPHGRTTSAKDKLVQGYHSSQQQQETHHQQQQNAEHRRGEPAGLQHSGEMHDTLDIFLSSEELSQGAEMLTSQDTKTNGGDDGAQRVIGHAQCAAAAKHASYEQRDNVHSVMETATKTQRNNNTSSSSATQHNQQQHQQQQTVVTNMGTGNDEAVAATKIQAGFRGYQVRKQMKLKKNGSDDAKMVKRCSSGRRRSSIRRGETPKGATDLEERSATKIQAGIRGFLVRKRQKSSTKQ